MYENLLIGRIVMTETTVREQDAIRVTRGYGQIVNMDLDRKDPFLIKYIFDTGEEVLEWVNGWSIEVIR